MKKLLLIILLFTACKKEETKPSINWNGNYTLVTSTCTDSHYSGSESTYLTISGSTIPPYQLSAYLYNPCELSISGTSATISPDPMNTGWDFNSGTASLNGNKLTVNYSFTIHYDNGNIKATPHFTSTYTK